MKREEKEERGEENAGSIIRDPQDTGFPDLYLCMCVLTL
jgi:hypothetical protein